MYESIYDYKISARLKLFDIAQNHEYTQRKKDIEKILNNLELLYDKSTLHEKHEAIELSLFVSNNRTYVKKLFEDPYRILFKKGDSFTTNDFKSFLEEVLSIQKLSRTRELKEDSLRSFQINERIKLYLILVQYKEYDEKAIMNAIKEEIPDVYNFLIEDIGELHQFHNEPTLLFFEKNNYDEWELKNLIYEINYDLLKQGIKTVG